MYINIYLGVDIDIDTKLRSWKYFDCSSKPPKGLKVIRKSMRILISANTRNRETLSMNVFSNIYCQHIRVKIIFILFSFFSLSDPCSQTGNSRVVYNCNCRYFYEFMVLT